MITLCLNHISPELCNVGVEVESVESVSFSPTGFSATDGWGLVVGLKYPQSSFIISAPFSPIIIIGKLLCALGINGIMEPSITLRPLMPCTFKRTRTSRVLILYHFPTTIRKIIFDFK